MRVSIKIEGIEETVNALTHLSTQSRKRIIRNASRAGATVAKRELRAAAPRGDTVSVAEAKYGTLRANIKTEEMRDTPFVAVTTGDAFWGRFQDSGTGTLNVKPGPRAKGAGARANVPPTYWFARTIERIRESVLSRMVDNLRTSIIREAGKLNKK